MKTAAAGRWIILDCLEFINNFFLTLRADDPLETILRRTFTEVVGKIMLYTNCSHGLHLLSNPIRDPTRRLHKLEVDHLYVGPGARTYLDRALKARDIAGVFDPPRQELPSYLRISFAGFEGEGVDGRLSGLRDNSPSYFPKIQATDSWKDIVGIFNRERASYAQSSSDTALEEIECEATEILTIPLSEPNPSFPLGKLGVIVLWRNQGEALGSDLIARAEGLIMAAKVLGQFLGRFFTTHYGATETTYLPSYRIAGQRSIGVMFADIRDFTPTTEIARNFGLIDQFTAFMSKYCELMCAIIQENGGRVHGLAGDGIMALFGEYTLNVDAVRASVKAAREMCREFEVLKQMYLDNDRIREFLLREVEPMSFGLGIGINYGSVIFDYFGAPGSRVYSPLGDHVNFAQRLESEANRFDERLYLRPDRMRAPILLSRPAWKAGKLAEEFPESLLTLKLKGKPYSYQAYEIWPETA